MPQVVNGCGTWYYGKNRVHRIAMTCPNCSAYADLESYDTTKYIVFLFVPLIPVSKWRVIEKCPTCTQHRAIKLSEWEKAKQADSAAVTEELRQDPTNPETVQKVIGVATSYQDENLFLQVAEKLAKPMTHDADVQAVLGSAYAYFGRRDQAEEAYKASLAVKEDPEVSEQLALQLLRRGQPEEAEKYLQHLLGSSKPEHAGFVHLLGEGYLADGRTERGLELLDEAAAMEPAIQADKEHQKLRKKAEKALGTSRPIPSPVLTPSSKVGYEEGGIGGRVAAWIGPLVAVILVAFYLSMAWSKGNSREVFVLNGLDIPYTATIAGQTIHLPPGAPQAIQVAEGTLQVSAVAGDQPVADTNVEVTTSFFARPFQSRTYVINPDRTALLSWEKQFYAENADNAPDGESELFVGETLYEFKDIDFEFAPFPMQLKMSGSGAVSRTRVALLGEDEVTEQDLVFYLPQMLEEPQYRAFLETKARFAPDSEIWVFSLQNAMTKDEYIAFLREGLDRRPLHVNWHRAYQSMMESVHPEHDLEAEYAGYLAADPQNVELVYLAGRATSDIDKSVELFVQAATSEPPSPFAANALAFQLVSEGQFEEAQPLIDRAVAADPQSLTFDSIDRTIKLATGKYDELIEKVRQRSDGTLGGLVEVSQVVDLLGYKEDAQAARQAVDEYFAQQSASADDEFTQMMRDALMTTFAYTSGRCDEFLEGHAEDEEPSFDVLFVRGDLEAAAEVLSESEEESTELAVAHLALSLRAHAAVDDALAASERDAAIEVLATGASEERRYAAALGPNGTSEPALLLRLPVTPEYKRVILTALGVRYPEHQKQYFALARRLNFERTVPWAFLREFLGQ